MNDPRVSIGAWLRASVVAVIAGMPMVFLPSGRVQSHVAQSDTEAFQGQRRTRTGLRQENDSAAVERQWKLWQAQHGEANPQQRLALARREYERRRQEARRQALRANDAEPTWTSLGPTNGAGRMTAIATHPNIDGSVYAGADNGGVWKTTDAGSSWVSLSDSLPSLEVGALAVASSNPNVIYLGSGSAPVYGVREMNRGIGLLKSTDGGASWSLPAT